MAQEAYYEQGRVLSENGDYAGAIAAFTRAGDYSDAKTQVENLSISAMAAAKTGDVVLFGSYEQDNRKKNGPELIDWIVLETDRKTVTLISRYALDCLMYNAERERVTWETCTLRTWLNGTFLQTAFSAEEQKRLQTVTVSADKNPNFDMDPGNATQDRVYLLSVTEVEKYFSTDSARVCMLTAYAKAQGATANSSGACPWWLRTPGVGGNTRAAWVRGDSVPDEFGDYVNTSGHAVRPVVVVGLSD